MVVAEEEDTGKKEREEDIDQSRQLAVPMTGSIPIAIILELIISVVSSHIKSLHVKRINSSTFGELAYKTLP